MIKVTDYVVQFLVDHGIHDIFLASGGGIMHLLDSVGRNPGMTYYCNYHEQACAVAAEGQARMTGKIAACAGTTGPGAINLLSGIVAAWVDSVPLIALSGQVRTDIIADYTQLRQVGPQEGNVIDMAKPVTKYAVSVRDAKTIRYHMERALYEATTGRPGPVWIELPLDVQGAQVDETQLSGYVPEQHPATSDLDLAAQASSILDELRKSRRPVIVPGNGIHYAGARPLLREFVERTQIPVLLPLTAKDLLEEEHPLQFGVFSGTGQRRANFIIQNSDCLLGLAAGFNIQKIGFNVAGFAPKAKKIVVDIAPGQLTHQILKPDMPVLADVRELLEAMLAQLDGHELERKSRWLAACENFKQRYPVMADDVYDSDKVYVNTYQFMDTLSDHLTASDTVVTGNGTDVVSYYHSFRVQRGQRTINTGWGSMGWDLPNAIGACIGNGRQRTILVTGDGSLQWNIQELLTLHHYQLPVKIFIFNNDGYTCIRTTQSNFFEGRFVGADPGSGVGNPDFRCLAAAYRLGYTTIATPDEVPAGIDRVLAMAGPVICEVKVAKEQGISPKASAYRREDGTFESRPLEDMAPFLPREEIQANMHLFDTEDAEDQE